MDLSTAVSALQAVATRIPKAEDASKALAVRTRAALTADDTTTIDAAQLREDMDALLHAPEWQTVACGLLTGKFLLDLSQWVVEPASTEATADAWAAVADVVLDADTTNALLKAVADHIEDREPRVRSCVVDLLEALCRQCGVEAYEAVKGGIMDSIDANFDRDGFEEVEPEPAAGDGAGADTASVGSASSTLSAKPTIAHDTVGWKALESSVRAIRASVTGCGAAFAEGGHLDTHLLNSVIPRASEHINRFVREAMYFLCDTIVKATPFATLEAVGFDSALCSLLARGLGDNWSQVRYASSVAIRSFLLAASEPSKFHVALVPRLALNRYYVAEGVRLYSQETWKLVMGTTGPAVVASVIDAVVSYYLTQSDADNHAVREAACHCIAELANKVDSAAVAPHVPSLLAALIVCFRDESWPVRDAACLATGRFVGCFPEESRPQLDDLYGLWFDHLWDNIWSVREDSAVSLTHVMRVYGDEAFDRILPKLDTMFDSAKDQPSESKKFGDLTNATTFGVAKRARDNDPALHTGQQVFSCGSLAPKLRKGGCMDHGHSRPREPWEATDGAVYLLREVASLRPEAAEPFLPKLAAAAEMKHFTHAPTLHETIWKQFPTLCEHLGKRLTKRHLELFVDPMVRCLRSPSRLAAFAAGECITTLQKFVGPRIFAGRLSPEQQAEVDASPYVGSTVPSSVPTARFDAAFSGVSASDPSVAVVLAAAPPRSGAGTE